MNLNKTQKSVLSLVSAALFSEEIDQPNNIDWKSLYQESLQQAVFPLVYSVVQDKLPAEQKKLWEKNFYQFIASDIQVGYEHTEVHNLLTEHNIPYVILKGNASASYYPDPLLRMMGDVDFLVDEHDLERAGKLLEAAGFVRTEEHEHEAHIAYHRAPRSTWEMHWRLSGIPQGRSGDIVRRYFSDVIDTATVMKSENGDCIVPNPFHHCLVMLVHTAEHMINTGIGLRHLCDWAVFANQVDVGQWKSELTECGLWRFAQLLTQLATTYLHMPERSWAMENVDTELLHAMICDIFAGGNFGRKDEQRINQAKLMTDKNKGSVDDTSFVRQFMAVMNEKARIALPLCRKIPVLLPIGWVYAGGRHLLRIKAGKRPKIRMKEMVEGAAERREIYKQFHLFETK